MKSVKTFNFSWEGIDQQGLRIKGYSEALNIEAVLDELKQNTITPLKINKKFRLFTKKEKIKTQNIIDFSRQLTTLINAGISLAPALQIIAQGYDNQAMKNLILTIKNTIETGHSFHETLAQYPKYFDTLYCNLIYIGECSGTLAKMLQQITQYQEKILRLKNKIKKALFYPAIVSITAVIITSIMLMFVVPQFKTMFQEFGAQLPVYTQIVIAISEKLKSYYLYILLVISILFFCFKWIYKKPQHAKKIDSVILHLPILGNIITSSLLARFARTLTITFNAGIPLANALTIIAKSFNNILFVNATLEIHSLLATGQSIAAAMQRTTLFPTRIVQMIAIAEESGTMAIILEKIAEHYEEQVDVAVDNYIKTLEPILMIILGIIIGGLVIAMYLPIFRIGTAI